MRGRIHTKLLALAFLLTILLARLDDGARSVADLFRLENVPAFVIYTTAFYLIFAGVAGLVRSVRRSR